MECTATARRAVRLELDMSEDEMFVLYRICASVGGARSGPRGVADTICDALRRGFDLGDPGCSDSEIKGMRGSIMMPDTFDSLPPMASRYIRVIDS